MASDRKACLCCLTMHQDDRLKNMDHTIVESPQSCVKIRLADTYQICCGIETNESDELNLICEACEIRLQSAYEFREMCRSSHQRLKEQRWPEVEAIVVKSEGDSDGFEESFTQVYVAEAKEEDEDSTKSPGCKSKAKKKHQQVPAAPGQTESNFRARYICYYCDIFLSTHDEYLLHRESLHRSPNSGHGFLRLDRTCNICNKNVKGFMKHIDEYHKDYRPNVCSVCNMAYQSQNELRWHLGQHLTADAVHECLACNKKFKSETLLRKHILTDKHTSHNRSYLCPYCGQPFNGFRQLYEHFKVHFKLTQNKPIFPCYFCKKCFLARKLYSDHKCGRKSAESKRSGPVYRTCRICDQPCYSDEEYACHKYAECDSKDDELKCNICGKEFTLVAKLNRHKRHHSYKPEPCVCDICGHTSQNQSQLNIHKTRHQIERPFKCHLCDCSFKVEHRLNSHMHRHKAKKYECDYCGKLFREYSFIRQHMAMHGTVTGLKQFTCEMCGKGLKSTTSLRRHMQVHTGQLEAKCDICKIEFRDISTYNHHYRKVHEGLVYECKYCLKTWLSKEKLREHLFVHRGFKPYHCPACPQQYVKKYLFVKHLRECHRIAFDLKVHGYRETENLTGFLKECERYTKRPNNGSKVDENITLRTGGIQLKLAQHPQVPQLRMNDGQTGEVLCEMSPTYVNPEMRPIYPSPYQTL